MGGWKLEIFRMSLYIAFPVTMFYVFNKPELFKDLMIEHRANFWPKEDPDGVRFSNIACTLLCLC
jgi:protein PET100